MFYFRVIVVEDGDRTLQLDMPFEHVPYEGDTFRLPDGLEVRVRHVISAARDGLAGVVLAWIREIAPVSGPEPRDVIKTSPHAARPS